MNICLLSKAIQSALLAYCSYVQALCLVFPQIVLHIVGVTQGRKSGTCPQQRKQTGVELSLNSALG